MKGFQPPGRAEEYFAEEGGIWLLRLSALGLLALVAGNLIGPPFLWVALAVLVAGVVTCAYAGIEAWQRVVEAPSVHGDEVGHGPRAAPRRARDREAGPAQDQPGAPGGARPTGGLKTMLSSVVPLGVAREATQSGNRPSGGPTSGYITEENSIFVKVAIGSWLFAGVGMLFVILTLFRVLG